ncbi:hypothetical protein RQ831_05720 [Roseomonas gilardii]|uniref:Uncharacterized protein n=1 Tax=Roseomonas gilardii TaxID=257708 RepID=A0ABU3MCG9_9PROT|nr:hypothetical protein [Roseomonas gilardii]MDT8330544.1 hypothetical protein [Roseomonas gilardii]
MNALLPVALAHAAEARRILLRENLTLSGFWEVEFLQGLPSRRIGPAPAALLTLPPVEGPVGRLRLLLAPADLSPFGTLSATLEGKPLALRPVPVPAEFAGLDDVVALEAPLEGAGAGRLELRLTRSLPHPDGTRLAGPLLLAVDRPLAPVGGKPAEKTEPAAPVADAKPGPVAGTAKAAEPKPAVPEAKPKVTEKPAGAAEPKPAVPKAGAEPVTAEKPAKPAGTPKVATAAEPKPVAPEAGAEPAKKPPEARPTGKEKAKVAA